ncbi:RNA polymerase sigma factor [Alkaliphilus transvaalensis]|uniref:RNA polymerase sigma factor n=1 Tax=Alkaliphilus transvaalensis TaxID=114628 RepID=UPI00047E3AC6|nr:sigma-70 family RNA polymerase sigma factor [Alkaliphilus transvaalensis]
MLSIYISMLNNEYDKNTLTKIYEEHRHALLAVAMKILNNRTLAEDAVHEAFVSIINHKEKYLYLDYRKTRASCVYIVKNKCIDIIRKQKRYSDEDFDELQNELKSSDMPVEEQVIMSSEYKSLQNAVKTLNVISQQVLLLKYYLDKSYIEIANELGITPKEVDNIMYYSKKKLINDLMKAR